MTNTNLNERVSASETTLEAHEKRIERLEDDRNILYKMNVLLETQIEANKTSKEEVKLLKQVVYSVNDNLTNLNHTQEKLSDKIDHVVERVDKVDSRIDEIEDDSKKAIEEDSISIKKIFYNVVKWIFYSMPISVLGAVILYYLNKMLGG